MLKSKKEIFRGEILSGHKGAAVEVPFNPELKWAISARPLWSDGEVTQFEAS